MAGDDLDNLGRKIAAFQKKEAAENAVESEDAEEIRNRNDGLRAGTELVACIGAGVLIGWGLDKWLETQPLFLIIFFLAGIGAAFLNIYKITQNAGDSVGFMSLHKQAKQDKKSAKKED